MRRNRYCVSSQFFFSFCATAFTVTFLPLYLRGRGLTLTEIGTLGAIYAFAGAVVQIPLGSLSDRLGRRKPLAVIAALILGSVYLLVMRAGSFWEFFGLYLTAGVLFFTIATLMSALISDWTAGTRTTGAVYGGTRIWGSIGFIASLVLMSRFPAITEGQRFLPVVTALFWLGGLSVLMVAEGKHQPREHRPLLKGLPKLFGNTNLTVFLSALFLYRICESSSYAFLSIYLKELHGGSSLIAMTFAFSAIVEIPFMLYVGGASDRMGRRPPMVLAFLSLPLRLFLYSQLRNPTDILYIQLLQGFTFSFMLVPSIAFVADLAPGELRATGQGLLSMISGIAAATGPFLGGWLADRLSISSMFATTALIASVAGMIFILFVRESQPDLSAEHIGNRIGRWHPILRPVVRLLSKPIFSLIRD